MFTEIASSSLADIAYRIATEPAFAQTLRNIVETRILENGLTITEAEATALKNILDLGLTSLKSLSQSDGSLGALIAWIG